MEKPIKATNRRSPGMLVCGVVRLPKDVPVAVDLDFVKSYGQMPQIDFDFSGMADSMRSVTEAGDPVIDWRSPLSMIDGYGRHAISIVRGMQRLGAEVVVREGGWFDREFMPDDISAAVSASQFSLPGKIGISMSVPHDPFAHNHNSPVKIIITQFETDRVPDKHVAVVNSCDHMIATTDWGRGLFKKSGVRIPIDVLTAGIDTDSFAYFERPFHSTFNVLLLGALTGRKNPLGAIRIFQAASKGNPDWRLTIKTRPLAPGTQDVQKAAATDARIRVAVSDASPEDILRYYYANDCLLWPSKGEGVGLPLLEAAATGMEIVSSDNSGMHDLLGSWCYKIRDDHMEAAGGEGGFGEEYVQNYGDVGRWWVPDEDHAARQLEKCFHNWLDGKSRGEGAAAYVRAHHTLRQQAESVLRIAAKYA